MTNGPGSAPLNAGRSVLVEVWFSADIIFMVLYEHRAIFGLNTSHMCDLKRYALFLLNLLSLRARIKSAMQDITKYFRTLPKQ